MPFIVRFSVAWGKHPVHGNLHISVLKNTLAHIACCFRPSAKMPFAVVGIFKEALKASASTRRPGSKDVLNI